MRNSRNIRVLEASLERVIKRVGLDVYFSNSFEANTTLLNRIRNMEYKFDLLLKYLDIETKNEPAKQSFQKRAKKKKK